MAACFTGWSTLRSVEAGGTRVEYSSYTAQSFDSYWCPPGVRGPMKALTMYR